MTHSTEPPWPAITQKLRNAADRAEERAADLRARADAIELEQRNRPVADPE